MGGQRGYSLSREGVEIVHSLEPWVEENLLPLLKPSEQCWQPQDLLPDPASEGFMDQVIELRQRAAELPDDLMVALVGDLITEEALPTYMSMLNTLEGTRDESGASPTPWARWTRAWTAEENRHGDALGKYLWLSGRVDPVAVERTTQGLIGAGMDAGLENNPYLCFMYTSFQERATKISHRNTARLATEAGDASLAKLCGAIASDEARHEEAYQRVAGELFRVDPDGAMIALGDMLGKQVVMPGHLMDDGAGHGGLAVGEAGGAAGAGARGGGDAGGRGATTPLFDDFAAVAERIGVYTAHDYAAIVEHLIDRWGVEHLGGLSGQGAAAQEAVCALPGRMRRLAEVSERRRARRPPREAEFAWLSGRRVDVS